MSKRALIRLATSICFMLCVMILGQVTAFADEVKPVHEYNFDSDKDGIVYDSIKEGAMNSSIKSDIFIPGYNGEGKARHFDKDNKESIVFAGSVMPRGDKSIRFKFRKDASTISNINDFIVSSYDPVNKRPLFWISITGTNTIRVAGHLTFFIPGTGGLTSPTNICDGKWHDILYTWDGTSKSDSAKLYVDDMTAPAATQGQKEDIVSKQFYIGECPGFTNGSEYFTGDLDDVQIFDSAITPSSETSSNLKAAAGDSKVDLTWNPVTDATSYTVKRATTAGGPYTTIATGITGTTYTDTGVTNGTTYYYVVSAIVNGSEGWSSNEASATPQASTDPNEPTGNKALLVITMVTGERKEYEMTTDKINDFVAWYNSKAASSPTYVIDKDYNRASFSARKDYIAYDQISNFEVNEYND